MSNNLKELIDAAKAAKLSREHWEEQRRSFVYGNTHLANELISRAMVDREAEKLAMERG
jgi:hypothetical protein